MKKKISLIFDGIVMPIVVYISFLTIFILIYDLFIKKIYEMNELLLQTFASVFIIIFFYFMYKRYKKKYDIEVEKIERKSFLYLIPLGISLCVFLNTILIIVFKNIDNPVSTAAEELLSKYPLIVTIIAIAIFPPFIEELFFRGFAYEVLKNFFGDIVAIIVTSLMFGISHGNIVQGVYAILAGIILGYIRYKFKNIIYPLMLHLIMNLSSIFLSGVIIITTGEKEKIFISFIMGIIAILSLYRIISIKNVEEK